MLIIASRFNWGDIQGNDRRESSGPFFVETMTPHALSKKDNVWGDFFAKDLSMKKEVKPFDDFGTMKLLFVSCKV